MTDKGNDPAARAKAVRFRDKSNAKVAPMYQQRAISTPVDARAVLTPDTQQQPFPDGRYSKPTTFAGRPITDDTRYSIPLMPFSAEDLKWRNRAQVMREAPVSTNAAGFPVIPGVGAVLADTAYWAYAQEQREKMMWTEFQQFILSQVNFSTPEARAYWEKKFPAYAAQARQNLRKQKELELELDDIRLNGFKDMNDMWLKFLYDKELLPGFTGDRVSNENADWLLYDYQNMFQQIGQPLSPTEGANPANSMPVGGLHPGAPGESIGVRAGVRPDAPGPSRQPPVTRYPAAAGGD